jgi:hypothetical protein
MWITVSVENEKLKINVSGRSFLLSPVSNTSFKALDAPFYASLDFAPDVKGKVKEAKLTMREGEEIYLVKTAEIAPLTLNQLKGYAGEYYSDELQTTYRLIVKEGALVFKHRNARPTPLKVMAQDKFIWGTTSIDFTRNKKKTITGFIFNAGRVTLEFIRK